MGDTIGLRELSHHTSRVIDRVRRGETIEVTDHGKPLLRLVPAFGAGSLRDRLIAEGRLKPAKKRGLPEPITDIEGVDIAQIVADLRAEERY